MALVSQAFRRHPDLEPTGKLTLLGQARCSAERMNAYLRRRNAKAPTLAELYLRVGGRYGLRGDVVFCQMVYETRAWTRAQSGPSWSPFMLEHWADEQAVERLMRILYAFAGGEPMPGDGSQADSQDEELLRRAGWRGTVTCWEDLNGKWSERGDRYGQDIVAIWRNMKEWHGEGEVFRVAEEELERERGEEIRLRIGGRVARGQASDWSSIHGEEMIWLKERGLLPVPSPHPERTVTWGELAALLRRMEKQGTE
ncbi:hypothetical protein [Cohnella panacarvi]|uniref:hypothetical protein n=1 Tax=Cohnella panacarvi TaxID=400776 RepID=UPI00047AE8A3|nr:hypothetical protein [Cohnella panacarvi]